MHRWRYRQETRDLDDQERTTAPGRFVLLTHGYTHYEISERVDSELTVLVHGFSVPMFIWNPTWDYFCKSGYGVVRYDLFGRGYSDRPDMRYNLECFVRQLSDLVDHIASGHSVNLVGLSMGGAICVGFAERYPVLVKRLALIDPSGIQANLPVGLRIVRLPCVGEIIMAHLFERILANIFAKDDYIQRNLDHFYDQYRFQMRFQGFRRALLSTIRHGPLAGLRSSYESVGRHPRPAVVIWGENDTAVPYKYSYDVRAAMPDARFYPIKNAGHIPHYEYPHRVNQILDEWLRQPA